MEAESSHHVRLDHEPSLDVAFAVLQASPPVAVYHMRRCISGQDFSGPSLRCSSSACFAKHDIDLFVMGL